MCENNSTIQYTMGGDDNLCAQLGTVADQQQSSSTSYFQSTFARSLSQNPDHTQALNFEFNVCNQQQNSTQPEQSTHRISETIDIMQKMLTNLADEPMPRPPTPSTFVFSDDIVGSKLSISTIPPIQSDQKQQHLEQYHDNVNISNRQLSAEYTDSPFQMTARVLQRTNNISSKSKQHGARVYLSSSTAKRRHATLNNIARSTKVS